MSSSSSISTATVNGRTVISGLSSGIDVDSIVEQLITAESTKLNKLNQAKQLAEWRQEAYQGIISDLQTFSAKYFDTTSASSILSQKTFQQFAVKSGSSAVTASFTSAASAGTHRVTVSQLATAATLKSGGHLSKTIQGTAAADYSSLSGTRFQITADDATATVTLDNSVTDLDSLQAAIDAAVGEGKITVSDSSGILTMEAAQDSGVDAITISAPDDAEASSALNALGFGSDATLTNRINASATLETLAGAMQNTFSFNAEGQIELDINGVNFTFDKDETLAEMMAEINSSEAGVTLAYDGLNDQLVLSAATTGAQKTLTVSETGSTFLSAALSVYTAGKDAKVTIDGQSMTRSSNTVTLDGVVYTLNTTTESDAAATVTLTQDSDAIYDSIKSFVDDYNALISTINDALNQEYDADYPPLTEAQEDDMSDDEISKWNAKAKTGLLQNDSMLQNMLTNLRAALSNKVSGQSLTLAGIGITTGSYDENGKLYIDEDQLKEAIQSDAAGVMELFTQSSTSYAGTTAVRSLNSGARKIRTKEEGIAYRFYDILQDNIGTIRDSSGNKGLLLEKAGIAGDASSTDNTLTDQIDEYEEEIADEEDRLDDERERLYEKYTALETCISELNSQLTSLQSLLDSMG